MEISSSLKILGDIMLIAVGTYAVIKSIQELMKFSRIKKAGYFVEGEIINYTVDNSADATTYPAVISYETLQGEKITATAQSASGIKPTIGKKVWIVYDPDNPSNFYFKKSSVPVVGLIVIIAFATGVIITILDLLGKV